MHVITAVNMEKKKTLHLIREREKKWKKKKQPLLQRWAKTRKDTGKKKKQVARKLHHNLKNKEDITKKQVKRRQC